MNNTVILLLIGAGAFLWYKNKTKQSLAVALDALNQPLAAPVPVTRRGGGWPCVTDAHGNKICPKC